MSERGDKPAAIQVEQDFDLGVRRGLELTASGEKPPHDAAAAIEAVVREFFWQTGRNGVGELGFEDGFAVATMAKRGWAVVPPEDYRGM